MAKNPKSQIDDNLVESQSSENEAFEMIELAIDDLSLLARAFEVINQACEQLEEGEVDEDEHLPRMLIN